MILYGKPVAEALCQGIREDIESLPGVVPTLCIVRLGEDPSDLAYERGICKRADSVGVAVQKRLLPADCTREALLAAIDQLNHDESVHGVLLFRPLPKHLRPCQAEIFNALAPAKDVDGMTDGSAAGIFLGTGAGFAPCTPSACMQMLDHYQIDPATPAPRICRRRQNAPSCSSPAPAARAWWARTASARRRSYWMWASTGRMENMSATSDLMRSSPWPRQSPRCPAASAR